MAEYIEKETLDSELYNRFHDEDEPSNITDVRLGSVRNFVRDFPTADAIPIPKGATNGDVIKAMFPNVECGKDELGNVFIISSAQLGYIAFRESWWNTPYGKERED